MNKAATILLDSKENKTAQSGELVNLYSHNVKKAMILINQN